MVVFIKLNIIDLRQQPLAQMIFIRDKVLEKIELRNVIIQQIIIDNGKLIPIARLNDRRGVIQRVGERKFCTAVGLVRPLYALSALYRYVL